MFKKKYLTAHINIGNYYGAYPFANSWTHGPIPGAGIFCRRPETFQSRREARLVQQSKGQPEECPARQILLQMCAHAIIGVMINPTINNFPFLNNLGGLNGAKEACRAGSPLPKAGYCEGSNDICGTTAGRGCWNAIFCDHTCDGTAARPVVMFVLM